MLSARTKGEHLENKVLMDLGITLLMGGTETTSMAIIVLLYVIARGHSFGNEPLPAPDSTPFVVKNSVWQKLVDEQ